MLISSIIFPSDALEYLPEIRPLLEALSKTSIYSFTTILGRFSTYVTHAGVLYDENSAQRVHLVRLEADARVWGRDNGQWESTASTRPAMRIPISRFN